MILKIKQIARDLFSADFKIEEENQTVGRWHFQNANDTKYGSFYVNYRDKNFNMQNGQHEKLTMDYKLNPYAVNGEKGRVGIIHKDFLKEGLFSKSEYYSIDCDNDKYELYPIGFGNEGYKMPVFKNDKVIAMITKECEVYKDMHEFTIDTDSIEDIREIICLCAYAYQNKFYVVNKMFYEETRKCSEMTKGKNILSKFNAS